MFNFLKVYLESKAIILDFRRLFFGWKERMEKCCVKNDQKRTKNDHYSAIFYILLGGLRRFQRFFRTQNFGKQGLHFLFSFY